MAKNTAKTTKAITVDTSAAAKPVKAAKEKKTEAATESKPRAKKEGMRKPQVRILAALKKAGKSLSRAQIAENAPCDRAWLNEWLGAHDEAKRKANDVKFFPSLLTLGFIRYAKPNDDGQPTYDITAAGKKAVEAAEKAAK